MVLLSFLKRSVNNTLHWNFVLIPPLSLSLSLSLVFRYVHMQRSSPSSQPSPLTTSTTSETQDGMPGFIRQVATVTIKASNSIHCSNLSKMITSHAHTYSAILVTHVNVNTGIWVTRICT